MIHRLDPVKDESLLRECFAWDAGKPQWFLAADSVFGPESADDFLKAIVNDIVIGIFDSELCGVLVIEPQGNHIFSAHLWAKRGAKVDVLSSGIQQVLNDFVALGMVEAFVWVPEKNRAIRKLCGMIDLQHEAIVMFRGAYRNKLIKWLKYSLRIKAQRLIAT